jgi:hypothetical protein
MGRGRASGVGGLDFHCKRNSSSKSWPIVAAFEEETRHLGARYPLRGRLESTLTGHCGSRPRTSQLGGGRAHRSRVGKDRSPGKAGIFHREWETALSPER